MIVTRRNLRSKSVASHYLSEWIGKQFRLDRDYLSHIKRDLLATTASSSGDPGRRDIPKGLKKLQNVLQKNKRVNQSKLLLIFIEKRELGLQYTLIILFVETAFIGQIEIPRLLIQKMSSTYPIKQRYLCTTTKLRRLAHCQFKQRGRLPIDTNWVGNVQVSTQQVLHRGVEDVR